jgi:copper chaperone CopZ
MKIAKFIAAIIIMLSFTTSIHAQTVKEMIRVYGNCGTCKKNIETAARQAGADKAEWDQDTRILSVSYDSKKTSNDNIQKKIAAVGYDTEKYTGDKKAYDNLDECCQYERKNKK